MLETEQFSDIRLFLKECIRSVKKNSPNLSSAQLAKKLSITTSTFNRLENGDTENPTYNNAFKIVREVCSEDNIQAFIMKFYPEMYKTYEKVYSGNQDAKFLSSEGEDFFCDPNSFEIMMIATTSHGLTQNVIADEFGKRGTQILEKLVTKGVLKEEQGKFSLGTKVNATQETVQKLLQNLITLSYDVDGFGAKNNWMSLQYESVNAEKVQPELVAIYRETNQKIRDLFSSPENKGTDVVWAGLVTDTLLKAKKPQLDRSQGVMQ